jgi:hypothetical protein
MNVIIYNLLSCHLRVFLNFSIAFTTILNYSGITTTGKFRIPHKQCDASKASRPSRLNSGCNYVTGIAHTIMFSKYAGKIELLALLTNKCSFCFWLLYPV